MEEKGFLGKNILGSGFNHHIKIFVGAGAYICGEETALLESMEGKKGFTRLKPPYPATEGLFSCPTVINNVETLSNIPIIFELGAEKYSKIGTPKSTGTRLISISGIVKKPGVYEVEQGKITLREIIFKLAGGIKEEFHFAGVIPGGISAPVLLPDEIDIPYDFESISEKGSMAGSGAIIVIGFKENPETELFEILKRGIKFFKDESCGKCTPCREGTWALYDVMEKISNKEIRKKEGLRIIKKISAKMKGLCACPLGESCALITEVFLKKYKNFFKI